MKKNIIAFALIAVALAAILLFTVGKDGSVSWPVINLEQPQDEAVAAAQKLVNAIPSPATLESEADVVAARDAYNALSAEQKAQIDEARIATAESEIAALKDEAAAKSVTDMIAALPQEPTEADLAAVEAARAAYDALSDSQKPLVTNLDLLMAAEAKLAEASNAAKAAEVDTKIAAIATPVTADSEADIAAARAAYDALTDEQKAACKNYELLQQLESSFANLSNASGEYEQGQTVLFIGGKVYATANSTQPAANISGSSVCEVTYVLEGKLHKYHLISTDGGGVYGWVDASSVRLNG